MYRRTNRRLGRFMPSDLEVGNCDGTSSCWGRRRIDARDWRTRRPDSSHFGIDIEAARMDSI